jgi:hypothetical protein
MKRLKRSTLRMILTKRDDVNTLTDLRTIIGMRLRGINTVKGRPDNIKRIMQSDLSWQKRVEWMERINNFTGKKVENIEWLTVLYNCEKKALKFMEKKSERVKGEKNPAYQHDGRLSSWSKKSEFYSEESIKKANENRSYNTRIDYYINKGFGLCQALASLKERQAVGRLDKFIERHGKEEGLLKWQERQEKWQQTLNSKSIEERARINAAKIGRGYTVSKAEKELFHCFSKLFDVKKNLTLDYNDGKNYYVYDFYLGNKIVEYNGDFWHANPEIYTEDFVNPISKLSYKQIHEKELNKETVAKLHGYEFLRVWELDYKRNKEKVIQECIIFLTQ